MQKGLGTVQHTGGVRFDTNSDLCQTLLKWLATGAPKDPPEVARVTGIEIFPKSAVIEGTNSHQRFLVQANYSDGSVRDVTPLAVFISNNDVTARVARMEHSLPANEEKHSSRLGLANSTWAHRSSLSSRACLMNGPARWRPITLMKPYMPS